MPRIKDESNEHKERLETVHQEHEHVQNAQVLNDVVKELYHKKEMSIEDKAAEAKRRLMERKKADLGKLKDCDIDFADTKKDKAISEKYRHIVENNPDLAKVFGDPEIKYKGETSEAKAQTENVQKNVSRLKLSPKIYSIREINV